MANSALRRDELRVIFGVGGVYGLRMLGLYMALPVLATWASTLRGTSPFRVGLCVGAYGLTQAIFQVPFGVFGDLHGRRKVVIVSLLLFAAGSAIVATATAVNQVVLGRLVQGSAAIASTMIALVGDATREEVRTRAMALIGAPLAVCFALGFVLGPIAADRYGVPSIFWLTSGLSLVGAAFFAFAVPSRLVPRPVAPIRGPSSGAGRSWSSIDARALLAQPSLLVLDAGIAVLHACVTGVLVVVPFLMRAFIPNDRDLWRVYGPAVVAGIVAMVWASRQAENPKRVKRVIRLGALALTTALVLFTLFHDRLGWVLIALTLFVAGFGMLEPVLAALVTKYVRRGARGTAAGVFNLSQFTGAFAGGLLGGWLLGVGRWAPFAAMACLVIAWYGSLARLRDPSGLVLSEIPDAGVDADSWPRVRGLLLSHPAVVEADWPGGVVVVSHWADRGALEDVTTIVSRTAVPAGGVARGPSPAGGATPA